MIKVKLMKYTAEPERTVAMAARLCYSPAGAEELSEKMTDEQVTKLVEKIISMGHASTMEHVTFTWRRPTRPPTPLTAWIWIT